MSSTPEKCGEKRRENANKSWYEMMVEDEESDEGFGSGEVNTATTILSLDDINTESATHVVEENERSEPNNGHPTEETVETKPLFSNLLKQSDSSLGLSPPKKRKFVESESDAFANMDTFNLITPFKCEPAATPTLPPPIKLQNFDECKPEPCVQTIKKEPAETTTVSTDAESVKKIKVEPTSKVKKESVKESCRSVEVGEKGKGVARKRGRDNSSSSNGSAELLKPSSKKKKHEVERDVQILARRQKQIDYGKNTIGYDNYTRLVPKHARTRVHPKTPPKHRKYSRRAWDGLIKVWRQDLHLWDSPDSIQETMPKTEQPTSDTEGSLNDSFLLLDDA